MGLMLEVALELLLEVVLGPLFELLFSRLAGTAERRRRGGPPLAASLLVGTAIGGLFSLVFPSPLLTPLVPGSSLLVLPLLMGSTMRLFGRWRELRGHAATSFATVAGGSMMGLGIAGTRLLIVLG